MNVNIIVVIYFASCVLGGMARVFRYYGKKGFKTPKLALDVAFSALGGAGYPWLVPSIITQNMPTIVVAFLLAAITYWTNHFAITMIKRLFGYQDQPGDEPPGQTGGTKP